MCEGANDNTTGSIKKYKLEDLPKDSILEERHGNLFSTSSSLAHCISQDLKLGAGIAKVFRSKYAPEMISFLQLQKGEIGGAYPFVDKERFIYNLITKKKYFEKPTYDSVKKTLFSMKEHALINEVNEISIPRIGCGLDGLKWKIVKEMISDVFSKSGIKIIVYFL